MTPDKVAVLATFLLSDAASDVTGQILASRGNEIFLMSQSRSLRSIHRENGWTPQTIAERLAPSFKNDFYPLERSGEVFSWNPI